MFDDMSPGAAPAAGPHPAAGPGLWDYVGVLRRYYLTGILVFIGVFALLLGLLLVTPKRYSARSKVAVSRLDQELQVDLGASLFTGKDAFFETQLQILKSWPVFEETLRRPEFQTVALLQPSTWSRVTEWFSKMLRSPGPAPGGVGRSAESLRGRAEALRNLVDVEPVKGSDVIEISVTAGSPELARDLANAIADVFSETSLRFKREKLNRDRSYLMERLQGTRDTLIDAENELRQFEEKMDATSLEKRIDFISTLRIESEGELSDVERQFKEAEAKLTPLLAQLSTARKGAAKASAEAYTGLQQRLLDLRLQRSRLVKIYTPEHPEVRRIEDELALVQSKVKSAEAALVTGESGSVGAMERVLGTYNEQLQELEGLRAREASLKQLVFHYQKKLRDYLSIKSQYDLLAREVEVNRRVYDLLLIRQKDASLKADMQFSDVRVIEPALLRRKAVYPKVGRSFGIAVFGGGVACLLALLLRFVLDRVVHDGKSLEIATGVPCLTHLPRSDQFSGDEKVSAELGNLADPVTMLGLSKEMGSPEDPAAVFLVTSAEPSEGKSTVASALAITFAHGGERTVLVDCDLRKPRVHKIFPASETFPSVVQILDEFPEEFPNALGVPELSVVVAGKIGELSPVQFLARERFARLLMRLRKSFQKVVIDSPPVNVVSDALHLAPLADRILLVARAEQSLVPAVSRAASSLQGVRGRLAGVVINDTPVAAFGAYQYGYYSYRYQYGYSYGADSESTGTPQPR